MRRLVHIHNTTLFHTHSSCKVLKPEREKVLIAIRKQM